MSEWTEAYMNVLSRARFFAQAWDEWRGNPEFTLEVARQRRLLEMTLAVYRVERMKYDLRRKS